MKNTITQDNINEYRTLSPLLDSIYKEIKTFALKKQDGSLSKLKVAAINQILERAKKLLDGEVFSEFLQILDTDTLPSNSDAVIVIAHYNTAMSDFLKKYTSNEGYSRKWNQDEVDSEYDEKDDEDEQDDD